MELLIPGKRLEVLIVLRRILIALMINETPKNAQATWQKRGSKRAVVSSVLGVVLKGVFLLRSDAIFSAPKNAIQAINSRAANGSSIIT